MSGVFYRSPGHDYPMAVRGEGVYFWDANGKQYLDGSGGAAISCLGHGHPAVVEAIREQAARMGFAHTQFFTNEPQEQLAAKLSAQFPQPGARTYFLSGGSEANETAMKLARQYHLVRGDSKRHVVISRRQSYHGNTLGALSVTGHLKRRQPYEAMLHQWPRVSPCYPYRQRLEGASDEVLVARLASELDATIEAEGAHRVSAFIAETVVGASLGAVAALPGYFAAIRDVCDRHGVLLILDEVMAGCGRTGSWFAFEQESSLPDIVTLAKGLGGGYQPLAAAVVREKVHDTVAAAGGFTHGHSYVGHATACAAGNAVLGTVLQGGMLDRVQDRGSKLRRCLHERLADHPHVGDIRGRGLFCGIELVIDKNHHTPVPATARVPQRMRQAAMDEGLICYPGGGTADGTDGAHILLAPPYITTDAQIEELCQRLSKAMEKVKIDV